LTELQRSVIKALGRIGNSNVVTCLIPFFNSSDHHVSKKAREVYQQLIRSSLGCE
jgi:hypothetical protein